MRTTTLAEGAVRREEVERRRERAAAEVASMIDAFVAFKSCNERRRGACRWKKTAQGSKKICRGNQEGAGGWNAKIDPIHSCVGTLQCYFG